MPSIPSTTRRTTIDSIVACLHWSMELIVWVIIGLSPWFVGGYLPQHVFLMVLGLCLLLLLWSLTQILKWRLTLYACWVSFLFVALFISAGMGLFSMPRTTLRAFSPAVAQLYDDLLPATREAPLDGPVDEHLPF